MRNICLGATSSQTSAQTPQFRVRLLNTGEPLCEWIGPADSARHATDLCRLNYTSIFLALSNTFGIKFTNFLVPYDNDSGYQFVYTPDEIEVSECSSCSCFSILSDIVSNFKMLPADNSFLSTTIYKTLISELAKCDPEIFSNFVAGRRIRIIPLFYKPNNLPDFKMIDVGWTLEGSTRPRVFSGPLIQVVARVLCLRAFIAREWECEPTALEERSATLRAAQKASGMQKPSGVVSFLRYDGFEELAEGLLQSCKER